MLVQVRVQLLEGGHSSYCHTGGGGGGGTGTQPHSDTLDTHTHII